MHFHLVSYFLRESIGRKGSCIFGMMAGRFVVGK